jgi:hypothetical protein
VSGAGVIGREPGLGFLGGYEHQIHFSESGWPDGAGEREGR